MSEPTESIWCCPLCGLRHANVTSLAMHVGDSHGLRQYFRHHMPGGGYILLCECGWRRVQGPGDTYLACLADWLAHLEYHGGEAFHREECECLNALKQL